MKLENAQKAADLIGELNLLNKELNTIKTLYAYSIKGITVSINIQRHGYHGPEFVTDSPVSVQQLLAFKISLIEASIENTKKELESL